jgi:cell division protein FtsB
MAKALFGHLPVADPRQQAELVALRRRVAGLEAEIARLHAQLVERDADDAVRALDLDVELRALDDAHAASAR